MNPDPLAASSTELGDPQSLNQYSHVEGNPLKMIDPNGTCEISAGIGMSPDSDSGKAPIDLATRYGFNVAFPYAGEDKPDSVDDIGLAGVGANAGATATAAALSATSSADGGMGKVFLGFSGGGQANILAGVNSSMGKVAFYDPGRGLGQGLPEGSKIFTGNGAASSVVNGVSGNPTGTNVPGCGHDVVCAINNSAALRDLIQKAGPCNNPTMFVRNPWTVGPLFPKIPLNRLPLRPRTTRLLQCHTQQSGSAIVGSDGSRTVISTGTARTICQGLT